MPHPFLDRLQQGPILADGAMGSMLYAEGTDYRSCFEELNLSRVDTVQDIHRRYISAGSELIETNTFGGNRFKLAGHNLAHRVRDINYRGARAAREAREVSGEPVFVAGSIGPTGLAYRPGLTFPVEDIGDAFREQVLALLEGGVDLLVFETFSDLEELTIAVRTARSVCDLPMIGELTFSEDLTTLSGQGLRDALRTLEALPLDAIGANCTIGPLAMLDVMAGLAGEARLPLAAMPNAGLPSLVDGRFIYLSTPQYFGEYAQRFAQLGVRIIGGCCGTTPQHVSAMREALAVTRPASPGAAAVGPSLVRHRVEEEDASPGDATAPTDLYRKLKEGEFVISVELDPPKGTNPAKVLAGAAMLKEQGVDCINIGDSPMARVRMSAIAMAVLIQQHVGLEAIIHFTTRDRNLMAIQSELIGAHALGVRNVIALTGDPPRVGDYPNATAVWDVDSVGLISILTKLNQGSDFSGNSIARPTNFCIAAAVTPTAGDRQREKDRLRRKIEAGAHLVMTQPLYTVEDVDRFLEEFGPLPVPVLLGVMPMQSARHAEFLHNEVGGIEIPQHLRGRMHAAGERAREEGMNIALEFVTQIRNRVNGVYIMPSFGRYETAAEITRALRHP